MEEEKVITLNEFKMVIEEVKSQIKKVVEVMEHRFSRIEERLGDFNTRFEHIDKRMDRQDVRTHSIAEQIALLHEGQTAIKTELRASLKDKVSYKDFDGLEKRVARLERKTA